MDLITWSERDSILSFLVSLGWKHMIHVPALDTYISPTRVMVSLTARHWCIWGDVTQDIYVGDTLDALKENLVLLRLQGKL